MLRIGTRGSALALAQTRAVIEQIGGELVIIESSGSPANDKERWTRTLDAALLDGSIDVAVHSAKDVPVQRPTGIHCAAIPEREDPRDRICGAQSLDDLQPGSTVGTASPRRIALTQASHPSVACVELRGNVDTRLRRIDEGAVDAAILAAAGLNRLGLKDVGAPLDPAVFTPAAGQGALMLECRSDDQAAIETCAPIDNRSARLELQMERAIVDALNADCHTAMGVLARADEATVTLDVVVLAADGSSWIRDRAEGALDEAAHLASEVVSRLRAAGADNLLASSRGETQ